MGHSITLKQLEDAKACRRGCRMFGQVFGESVHLETLEEAKAVAVRSSLSFDFHWAAFKLLSGNGYQEFLSGRGQQTGYYDQDQQARMDAFLFAKIWWKEQEEEDFGL